MKKRIALILCLFLIFAWTLAGTTASAHEADYWTTLENCYDVSTGYRTFAVQDAGTGAYTIYDEEYQPINSEQYSFCSAVRDACINGYDLYRVARESGMNIYGCVDGAGNTVIPLSYAKIEYLSDRWQYGIAVEKSDSSVSDFRDYDGNTYIVSYYDIYYRGAKVLTLSRSEFDGTNLSAYAFGDYLLLRDLDRTIHAYDKTGAVSNSGQIETASEYDGWKEYKHIPTGTSAFTPGCTLTSDEVKQDLMPDNGLYYDLQGNVFPLNNSYSSVSRFEGNYARVERQGLCGLINRRGQEVIPCQFDSSRSYDWPAQMEKYGYAAASKDGKFCFVNSQGVITYQSPYDETIVKGSTGIIRYVQDLTGEYILLTPEGGELSTRYSEYPQLFAGSKMAAVREDDGSISLIDIDGNTVVNQTISGSSTVYMSGAGNLFFVYTGSRQYAVYKITESESTAHAEPASEPSVANDNKWFCPNCGKENNGNFCSQCGTARPVDGIREVGAASELRTDSVNSEQEEHYQALISAYRAEEYDRALEEYINVTGYQYADRYYDLIRAKFCSYFELTEDEIVQLKKELLSWIDFEDAAHALVTNPDMAEVYLRGFWTSSGNVIYTLEWENGWDTTLPVVPYSGNYAYIYDGTYWRHNGDVDNSVAQFDLKPVSETAMDVYCYQTKGTYRLNKVR